MLLMHKDDVVAKFNLYKDKPSEITKIYDAYLMPIGLHGDLNFVNRNFPSWAASRAISQGRLNRILLEEKLNPFGGIDKVAIYSMGLSLIDTYWYKFDDSQLTWRDADLHKNSFKSDLLNIEFDLLKEPDISPDYTTNGMLKKFWTFSDGIPALIKSGEYENITNGSGVLAANEVVASQIARTLKIDAVEYSELHLPGTNEAFSISKCFTKDNEDFVSGADILRQLDTNDKLKDYDYISSLGFTEQLQNMITLDVLLHNVDRHSENYGIILNADTLKPVRFAPVYDTGSCLAWTGHIERSAMKFPETDRESNLKYINRHLHLPEKADLMHILDSVYTDFKVPDKQTALAKTELSKGYNLLSKELQIDHSISKQPEQEILTHEKFYEEETDIGDF